MISPVKLLFEACHLRVIAKILKFSGLNSLLKASNLRTFAEVFLEKVSLPEFLYNSSMGLSCADIFQHITICQAHGYLFHSTKRILKVESKMFCQREGTRIASRKNSFARN